MTISTDAPHDERRRRLGGGLPIIKKPPLPLRRAIADRWQASAEGEIDQGPRLSSARCITCERGKGRSTHSCHKRLARCYHGPAGAAGHLPPLAATQSPGRLALQGAPPKVYLHDLVGREVNGRSLNLMPQAAAGLSTALTVILIEGGPALKEPQAGRREKA